MSYAEQGRLARRQRRLRQLLEELVQALIAQDAAFAASYRGHSRWMRDLVVSVENADQREALLGFLRERKACPRPLGERSVVLDLDGDGCPALATLVAELDAWRGRARVGEAVLSLGEERRILRTEI
jgi:hypothetical protein